MGEFEKRILEKIKNKESLDFNELQMIERLLYLASFHEALLNIQIGLDENELGLEFVAKKPSQGE